jgi:hypothetical protein
MFKNVVSVCCVLFAVQFLNANPAADTLLSADIAKKLFETGLISAAHFDDLTPSFAPQDENLLRAIADAKSELAPSMLIESLSYYRKPVGASAWTQAERTALFNGVISISTLAGLRYYSNSKKGTRLFYEKSNVIESPQNKNIVRDPLFTDDNLPESLTLYARQKDLTFGDNIYKLDFSVHKDAVFFSQRNETAMYYGIIPVLGKGDLHSIIALIDSGNDILIYMVSMADAVPLFGMKTRVAVSFSARADAVLGWFKEKADAVYKERSLSKDTLKN